MFGVVSRTSVRLPSGKKDSKEKEHVPAWSHTQAGGNSPDLFIWIQTYLDVPPELKC